MRSRAMSSLVVGWPLPVRMSSVKRLAYVATAAVTLALACGTNAAGLFLPADAAIHRGPSAITDMHERPVRIARQELSAVRHDVENARAGHLLLNVEDGTPLDVVVERTTSTKWGYSLSGRVRGAGGFVTLVVHGEAVAGSIWTPSASYELLPLGDDIHVLRDLSNEPAIKCGGMAVTALDASSAVTVRPDDETTPSVVDILVVYTSSAEERAGRGTHLPRAARSRIEAFAHLGIAVANDAFERSGAFILLNLVGLERVDHEVSTHDDDSSVLRTSRVGALRNRFGADLVHAIVGCCFGAAIGDGLSYLTYGSDVIFIAHEVGHSFGIKHERNEFRSIGGPLDYRHGFTTGGCDQTIMSYGTECRDRGWTFVRPPFFASPWRYNPGDGLALGVTRFAKERGARGPADAVLTLNRNRHRVANYRPSRSQSSSGGPQ